MNFIDDLGLDDNFDGSTASNSDENLSEKNAPSGTQKHKVDFQADSRRKLKERLEASRVKKQAQDYDFDLDFDLDYDLD